MLKLLVCVYLNNWCLIDVLVLVDVGRCLPITKRCFLFSVPSSLKVNSKEVCFGTRGNSYGSFTMPYYGKISAFKLVHLRGSVSCRAVDNRFSYWRCDVGEFLNTFLTNSTNAVVFPQISGINSYTLPGIWSNSSELTFKNVNVPLSVSKGQKFRVWYGEDLKDESETDNGGRACMDIYALYV